MTTTQVFEVAPVLRKSTEKISNHFLRAQLLRLWGRYCPCQKPLSLPNDLLLLQTLINMDLSDILHEHGGRPEIQSTPAHYPCPRATHIGPLKSGKYRDYLVGMTPSTDIADKDATKDQITAAKRQNDLQELRRCMAECTCTTAFKFDDMQDLAIKFAAMSEATRTRTLCSVLLLVTAPAGGSISWPNGIPTTLRISV